MHLKRQKATTRLPIPRKGKTFIARASSNHKNSVPTIVALRDMLKLARTKKEASNMINEGKIKINGKTVKDHKESIKLFNLFQANNLYELNILPTGKFNLKETKNKDSRLCKVIGKKLLKGNKIQLNLHDGTNVLTTKKINVSDSVYLDLSGKLKTHAPLEKGSNVVIIRGKYLGLEGKVESIKDNKLQIKFKDNSAELNKNIVVIK